MNTRKRSVALVLVLALMCSLIAAGFSAKAGAADHYVSVDDLADNGTAAPAKDAVVPDANQYQYQKKGLSAFCHFGPNTFNEIEWGEHYGSRTPDEIFKLEENFDAEKLVRSLKEAGFGTLIVTAKHHDGFCIWDSAYTTYDSSQSSYGEYDYDGMGGDVLAEISAACTKYDLDMGLYLSPWDIHDPAYGYYTADGNGGNAASDVMDYNDYYNAQLEEILSNPIYGNDGHFVEVWMDGAKGSGANAQDYDFQRWFATIQRYEGVAAGYPADAMLIGAEAYSTVYWIGNESGLSNEETWSKVVVDKTNNTLDRNHPSGTHYSKGWSNGNQWAVPEADSKITSGWFWGNSKKTPATMADLANRYFNSVGYNSVMLLNVPPNNMGTVDEQILARVVEFGEAISGTFASNKAKDGIITASEVRGKDVAYSPANLLDGDPLTYWTVEDNTTTGSVIVDLGKVTTFDVVSIEESIEFGQRITSFKVEYSSDGQNWTTMKEGTTVGAKRLVRTAPVKAQYVKITVNTNTDAYTHTGSNTAAKGSVPMLTEIGIYKASEGFALGSGAPDGMEVIDERDSRFSFSGSWNNESGSQFPIEQTSKWCNSGAGFTVSFTGSKIYLVGTVDPNHSTANVTVDGKTTSINTWAASRSLGQIIYTSDDLPHGEHTLTLQATGTIGIDGAYVINNSGVGMIGIENAKYTMNEDQTMEIKLVRVGGSAGAATVLVSPNPGTAVQGDYDTELIQEITFAEGETEKTALVRTKRNTNTTGDQYFTVELSSDMADLILGFNAAARITILDAETHGDGGSETPRTQYTPDDRFGFPADGETVTLEMDLLELHNNPADDNGWPLQITEKDWASGGKFLNCLNSLDEVYLYYTAEAGEYSCTMYYRSGDPRNSIEWYDDDGKVESGTSTAGAGDSAGATHEVTFTIKILEGGDGLLKFSGGEFKGPQIDRIVITRAG
ncbi:MAG: alpha-L-fucosidase [Oscillospiraceae bacterium]|nr:alpha-L-fucosidase [Oscillospiraceae bacterium]